MIERGSIRVRVPPRAGVKNRALVDEKSRPYFTNEAIGISIKTQDSICVNLSLYIIRTKLSDLTGNWL